MRVLFWSCHTLCMLYFQCVRTSSFISILYDVLCVPVMFTFIYGSIFSSGHLSSCSFPFRGGVEAVLKHHSFLASWYNKISPVLTVYVTLKKKKAVLFPIKLTLYSILFESNLYYKTQINLAHRAFYHIKKKTLLALKPFFEFAHLSFINVIPPVLLPPQFLIMNLQVQPAYCWSAPQLWHFGGFISFVLHPSFYHTDYF